VFPVRYELEFYILFRRNSVFKGLTEKYFGESCHGLFEVLSQHLLVGSEKTKKTFSQDNVCIGRDPNPPPPEYTSRALPLH
jgi:hypothetical protein